MKRCGEWVRFKEATKKIEDLKQALSRSEEIRVGMRGECNCANEPTRAKAEIRKLRHAVNGLTQTLRIAATSQSVNLELESVECNCVERFKEVRVSLDAGRLADVRRGWVCPTHRYKRL